MIRIKIFCPFASSKACKDVFERINHSYEIPFYGPDQQYHITDGEDYTHAVIMNTAMPQLNPGIPKSNVLGLAFEPVCFLGLSQEFIDYAVKHIGKYYIGDSQGLPALFVEHFGYMWHSRPSFEIDVKPNVMSIIVSEKCQTTGHMYRHQLTQRIVQEGLPVDIWGRGAANYPSGRVRGQFSDCEPYEYYSFSICIENVESNHYFSEKVVSPLMFNCVPIYLGCRNIDSYVDGVMKLSGDVSRDIELIKKILANPAGYYRPTYVEKNILAVNFIYNLPNIFPSE